MKLNRISTPAGDPVEEHYIVEEISLEDIAPPSERFLRFIRDLHGFSFINVFTIDEFTAQVRKCFVSGER